MNYCPMTDICEPKCSADFETEAKNPQFNHTCKKGEAFCSNEESCNSNVDTPTSFTGSK